jgi:hypothetical protein
MKRITLVLLCALCLFLAASTGCETLGYWLYGEENMQRWEGYPESYGYKD